MWQYIKENWIALVALGISVISFFKDNINEFIKCKQAKNEEKKAKICISFINKKLIISNKGKSCARNVRIYVDDDEIQDNPMFGVYAKDMDFSLLTPLNSYTISGIMYISRKTNYQITVKWDDDNAQDNIVKDIINI